MQDKSVDRPNGRDLTLQFYMRVLPRGCCVQESRRFLYPSCVVFLFVRVLFLYRASFFFGGFYDAPSFLLLMLPVPFLHSGFPLLARTGVTGGTSQ